MSRDSQLLLGTRVVRAFGIGLAGILLAIQYLSPTRLRIARVVLKSAEPNSAWVTQQARNLSRKLSDEGINVRVVVHDRDRKFARRFDAGFEGEGARVILAPLMAPRGQRLRRALGR